MIPEIKWMLRYKLVAWWRVVRAWPEDISSWIKFWRSYRAYGDLAGPHMKPRLDWLYPCLGDDTEETYIEPIYFYQDAWAFEQIMLQRPQDHVDVGSHHKFVALLSKAVPVTMVDIRPLSLPLESLQFRKGTILNLPFE
ncbi:MAG: hypothetical protein QME27_06890, partial [Syntrophaceae bacterium]|nr:hypothetical protein [Syntrophaceae bacterium]